jgi:hypothetical protein
MLLALLDWVEREGCGGFIPFFLAFLKKSEVIIMVRGFLPFRVYTGVSP